MKALLILKNGETQTVDYEPNPFRKHGYDQYELREIENDIKNKFNNSGLVNKVVRVHLYRN